MNFSQTDLPGVLLIKPELLADDRGSFARSFCVDEFAAAGIDFNIVQANISFNKFTGTVRGMHFQRSPHAEAKVVRCTSGAMFDVVVDLRPDSATYCQWIAAELNADNRDALFIPEGCAHGFLTLTDEAEVYYQISTFYHSESAAGVRWNDPAFQVVWPSPPELINSRDAAFPNFSDLTKEDS